VLAFASSGLLWAGLTVTFRLLAEAGEQRPDGVRSRALATQH